MSYVFTTGREASRLPLRHQHPPQLRPYSEFHFGIPDLITHLIASFALRLGVIHRRISMPDEVLRTLVEVGAEGDADTAAHLDALSHVNGLGELAQHAFSNSNRISFPSHIINQQRKFVTAISAHDITFPQTDLQPFGDLDEDGIPGLVTQSVVDRFKPIEIDKQDRKMEFAIIFCAMN